MDATEELAPAAGGALVLGRYRLGARLGSGGFGTVFAGRDERLDRPVAIKVVPAAGPVPERARREALAAARLDHPGIVAVYDAGVQGSERFLVSELVRGRTLAQLEREDALSDADIVRIGASLAGALAHAHERGVIHRDVKPQNVIVPDEASSAAAKLLDFGVAHLASDDPLTLTGDVVGTLAYMAPEQAAGQRVDERADLYALALVLYEALSGTNPVRQASPAATARRVGTVLPSLRRARRDLPPALSAEIDRALAPGAGERGTLAELAGALDAALPQVSDDAPDGGFVPPPLLARLLAGAAAGGLAAAALIVADDRIVSGDGLGAGAVPASGGAIAAVAVAVGLVVAALPRAGWLLTALAAIATLRDDALALAAALVAPPLLLRRDGLAWSVPAAAPLLGLAGIAGAYPAVAAAAPRAWTRAALGAIGLWWLVLCNDHDLATTVLAPVWAAAALVLPWLVAGRTVAIDVLGATVWAAALAATTAASAEAVGLAEPRGLVGGAIVAGALAVMAARARNTVNADDDRA